MLEENLQSMLKYGVLLTRDASIQILVLGTGTIPCSLTHTSKQCLDAKN